MTNRYFVEEPISHSHVTLSGPEAHHLIHVMRAGPGTQVVLFDGSGAEFPAVVDSFRRSTVELSILSRDEISRELPMAITLGVTLPKGDRQKWLIEKAVELGVARVVPLSTDRAVAQPVEQAVQRLRRSVIEASKQCGRNQLMQIDEARSWPDFIADTAGLTCRLLAHPRTNDAETELPPVMPDRVAIAVGPEGGFTDAEVALAVDAGWQSIDLGSRILRIETAAIAMAVLVATP